MISRHIFISFSHEDLQDVNLLRGQAKNSNLSLQFDDYSIKSPFNSTDAYYIKKNISEKIRRCSVTMVYLTKNSAFSDWVRWEIQESQRQDKKVFAIYKEGYKPYYKNSIFDSIKIIPWRHDLIMNELNN